jgi:hypothetical protein
MGKVVVEITDPLAARLAERALTLGVPVEELAMQAVTAYLEQDPYEFIGIAESDEVHGRGVDEQLEEHGFGRS